MLARELRRAFVDYGKSVKWRWQIRIYSLSPAKDRLSSTVPRVVRVDLTSDDARVLADLLNAATEPDTGSAPRGPIGTWLGTEDVAARIGVQPSTIRGWIARHGPKTHPFPAPDEQYRGRNYWKKATADGWKAAAEPDAGADRDCRRDPRDCR